ncbi:gp53-like domain-containing protein [Campylobacter sp. RM12637]|uniref:gp53-like domain-containing protein n=1 Tax=Campylobacter sp. RM12637 TaxID=2735734 RepID=UPI0030143D2A|nr:hypothetical protein [Campylobacter sp. RM12637]
MEEIQRSLSELITNQRAMLDAQSKLLASVYDKQVVDNKLNNKLNITDFTAIKNAINMHLNQKSFADNGYTKLPNGLILQWINANNTKVSTEVIKFPIAFPNKVLSVIANSKDKTDSGSSIGGGYGSILHITNYTNTQVEIHKTYWNKYATNSNVIGSIFAIGY